MLVDEDAGVSVGALLPELRLCVRIRRRASFFVWTTIFPINLITVLGATAWIPMTCDINTRLQNVLLMALTLVAFKLSLQTVVPMVVAPKPSKTLKAEPSPSLPHYLTPTLGGVISHFLGPAAAL